MTMPDAPVAIEPDSIAYETGPCFGACPVLRVSVRPDGSGIFEGRQHTVYHGCDMEKNRAIAERLRRAPTLLPISGMIGRPL